MSTTGLLLSDVYQEHVTMPGHPERSERIEALVNGLKEAGLTKQCTPVQPIEIDERWLLTNHSPEYLDRLKRACKNRQRYFDSLDCSICERSFHIAKLAAGGVLQAVDAVMAGNIDNACCLVRPPGHHAEHSRAMGFCYFNNAAVAARYLIEHHGLERILILDWDVHHGNGTQHSFEREPKVFYCSFHAHPSTLFPGTGYAEERGKEEGYGYTLNLPMEPGSTDEDYRKSYYDNFIPAAEKFRPQFVIVSAGFDAHQEDPLGNINLTSESFRWLTKETLLLARNYCDGRFVSMLEGGYSLRALTECAGIHIEELLE